MLKSIQNVKNAQRNVFIRILHIQAPFKILNFKSIHTKKVSDSKNGLIETLPYVIATQNYRYKEGSTYEGFQCERVESIPDFGLTSCSFRHLGTGTEFWYLDSNDIHNVFSINLRTTPFDSSGVAHVLEHLTLCGSKKYPVRNLYFKMFSRSVSPFMNAMTGHDFTSFHFSTMNEVDFRNLQKIYLDAVFRPNLFYLDFLEEAWRLEYSDVHNKNSDLTIKGVVYNEIKGAFSDISKLFHRKMRSTLLSSHTYANISAGSPQDIPKLTHKDLVEFHRKYYHPSNATMFCYGSFDLEKTLAFVDQEYLSHYDCIDNSYSIVPLEKRWSQPCSAHIKCRPDSMGASFERQNQIGIGLLMCDVIDIQENFECNMLSDLMIRGPNSAFSKTLIKGNFSGGYCYGIGYLPNNRTTCFIVGLRELKAKDFSKFNDLYDFAVHKASKDGFEPDHIESVLSNLELSFRNEIFNFGSRLKYVSSVILNHGGDVVSGLRVTELISVLRRKLKENPKYLQEKVEKYFTNNPHKLTLTMSPDENYNANLKLSEAKLLVEKLNEMSDEEFNEIYENGIKLEETQRVPENLEVLPCLAIGDVKDPVKRPLLEETTLQNVPTQLCKVSANGITYFKCMFNITGLSHDDAMLAPLLCKVISEIGTSKYDYLQFDKLIGSKMGPITCNLKLVEDVFDGKSYRLGLLMSTHALDRNVPDMFQICQELMLEFKLEDTDRLKMLIDNYISQQLITIEEFGHLHAMLISSALITNAGKLRSQLEGVEHIDFMKNYFKQNSIEDIRDRLVSLGSKIFGKNNVRVAINSSDAYQSTALEHCDRFLKNLLTIENKVDKTELHLMKPSAQHYFMNMRLSYCAKSILAVPYAHEDHPVLRILANFVSSKYLLPVVRQQNGAYDTAANIGFDGIFTFFSYRDPHATKSIEVFDKTYEWLQDESEKLDEQALLEAKLTSLQVLDRPLPPGNIGTDNFVMRVSYDLYSRYRARLLSVTVDEVKNVVEKYLKNYPKHFGKCILGPEIEKMMEGTNNRAQI